jgi:hypothetical protein
VVRQGRGQRQKLDYRRRAGRLLAQTYRPTGEVTSGYFDKFCRITPNQEGQPPRYGCRAGEGYALLLTRLKDEYNQVGGGYRPGNVPGTQADH